MNPSNEVTKEKSCCWSVTINNPTEDDIRQWGLMKGLHWVREVSGQIEKGEEGTPHLQGCLQTTSVRFAQVKKALPRAHIEAARSQTALAKYVVKQDTRVASIAPVKTATQHDVQKWCAHYVALDCYKWQAQKLKVETVEPWDYDILVLITEWKYDILHNWEKYVDDAVRDLIIQGYYGVEYVMANAQVRNAFKKYLPEICYRHYAAPSPSAPQDPQGQEADEADRS